MIVNCPKCDQKFDNAGKWNTKKFCSRKCANSRRWDEAVNKKRRDSLEKTLGKPLSKKHSIACIYCKKITPAGNKFCDNVCFQEWRSIPAANFCYEGKGSHKKVLIRERGHVCESCKNSEWLGRRITLELEHIDGDNKNNVRENLKLLCPNCHSYTPTWRKAKKPRNKYTSLVRVPLL